MVNCTIQMSIQSHSTPQACESGLGEICGNRHVTEREFGVKVRRDKDESIHSSNKTL